jgi:hypothetical protein
MQLGKVGKEGLSALWFGTVGLAFFAPALGVALPMNIFAVLYSVVLLASVIVLVLSLLSQKGKNNHAE